MGATNSTDLYKNQSTPCMNNQNEEDISKCIKNKSNLDEFVLFLLPGSNGKYFATRYNKYPLRDFYQDNYKMNYLNPFKINIWAGDQKNKVFSFDNSYETNEIFMKFIPKGSKFNVILLDYTKNISLGVLNTLTYDMSFENPNEIKYMKFWDKSGYYDRKTIYEGEGGMINTGFTSGHLLHPEGKKLSPANYHFYGVDYENAYEENQKMYNSYFIPVVEQENTTEQPVFGRKLKLSPKRTYKPYERN